MSDSGYTSNASNTSFSTPLAVGGGSGVFACCCCCGVDQKKARGRTAFVQTQRAGQLSEWQSAAQPGLVKDLVASVTLDSVPIWSWKLGGRGPRVHFQTCEKKTKHSLKLIEKQIVRCCKSHTSAQKHYSECVSAVKMQCTFRAIKTEPGTMFTSHTQGMPCRWPSGSGMLANVCIH